MSEINDSCVQNKDYKKFVKTLIWTIFSLYQKHTLEDDYFTFTDIQNHSSLEFNIPPGTHILIYLKTKWFQKEKKSFKVKILSRILSLLLKHLG